MILHHLVICPLSMKDPMHEVFNQRWYIQHLMDESEMKLKILLVMKIG